MCFLFTERHPISNAIDGTNNWWQSPSIQNGREYHWVTITLDLRQVSQAEPLKNVSGLLSCTLLMTFRRVWLVSEHVSILVRLFSHQVNSSDAGK